jgi:hypothetical protein
MEGRSREKNPVATRAVESGPNWTERRESFYEKVEGDIVFFENTYREILDIKPETDEELLRIKFNRLEEQTKDHFPGVRETLKEIALFSKRIEDSRNEDLARYVDAYRKNPNIDHEDAQNLVYVHADYREELYAKQNALYDDPNLRLARRVIGTLDHLKEKFRLVRYYENRWNEVFEHPTLKDKIRYEDCDYVLDVNAFDIDIFVQNSEAMMAYIPQSGIEGLHLSGTPFNLIAFRPLDSGQTMKDREKTAHHESIHNLLDAASLERGSSTITGFLKALETPSSTSAESLNAPESVLNSLQEELLAEIQSIENIQDWPSTFTTPEQQMDFAVRHLATAGRDAVQFVKGLENIILKNRGGSFEKNIREIRKKFITQFNRMVDALVESFRIARNNEEDAELMAHVSMLVLPPSKYHHIPKLLKRRYGEGRREEVAAAAK